MLTHGILIVSLDFELYWGVRDKRSVQDYAKNLNAVYDVVPRLLELFEAYDIHASWASVGLLFAKNTLEACRYLPDQKPSYHDAKLNPYSELERSPITQDNELYYCARDLLERIKSYPHQEIASHTFSHYYCLEPGQTREQFAADLHAAKSIAAAMDVTLNSLVFPRNQYNNDYLSVASSQGIKTFRGNETSRLHQPRNERELSRPLRALRLLDSYVNISGQHIYDLPDPQSLPINLQSSRFLRAYSHRLRHFEPLKQNRITRSLKKAAKQHKIYHLWWHPHNFGTHTDINFKQLENLLVYVKHLKQNYGLESLNMEEVYERYYQ